jgi:hypothetical protein
MKPKPSQEAVRIGAVVAVPCGARTRAGGSCRKPALASGRCRIHNGKAASGIASPTFVHGRHSRSLPARLVQRYHESLADPNLLTLQSEIAVADAHLAELFELLDAGGGGAAHYKALTESVDNVMEAFAAVEADPSLSTIGEMGEQLKTFQENLSAFGRDRETWADIQAWQEQRRKLARTETQRIVQATNLYTPERVIALCSAVLALVRENVTDRRALAGIQSGIDRIVAQDNLAA